jgi:hypothetical protein
MGASWSTWTRRAAGSTTSAATRASLTALGEDEWYRQVTLMGEVVSIEPDRGLRDIDRLSTHYSGEPFSSRHQHRWSAWVRVDRWFGWDGGTPWPPGEEGS